MTRACFILLAASICLSAAERNDEGSHQPLTLACPASVGDQGTAYSSGLVATGGTPPYHFAIAAGALPPGVSLNHSSGAITGTPTSAGQFNFVGRVTDSQGQTAFRACSISVLGHG